MYELRAENLHVRVSERDGIAFVTLDDRISGATWGPVPAFRMEIYSIALRREETDFRPKTVLTSGPGWIEISQSVHELHATASATVRFQIEGGELVARIPSDRITSPQPELSLLAGIDLLPGFLSVEAKTGALALPIVNGALCYPERHPDSRLRFLMYGEQPQWELMPMLPCCGAIRSQDKAALMALAEQGECDAECRVEIDTQGDGHVGFCLKYRYTPVDPVDPTDRVVRFVPLRGRDAGYAGMGRRLHRFVLQKSGRGTLAERAAGNPDIAYAANSFVLKIMHACKEIGSTDGSGKLHVYTTFDQARDQLSAMKQAGIERCFVQLTGWNLEGHDGCWPTRFPPEPALGGEAGLRRLLAHGQSLGYQMQVHDNYIDRMARSPEFDPNQCVGGLHGGPLVRGCWAGGLNHAGWPLAYPEEQLTGQMERVRALGARGVAYLDAMGLPLEVSYNMAQGPHRYRRACADGVNTIIRAARATYGAAGVETGYLYCAVEADYVVGMYHDHAAMHTDLVDVRVPLWQMAVKGHAICNLHDTFNGAIALPSSADQTVSRRMLTMAEFGLLPRNEITAARGDWGYPLGPVLDAMRLEYDLMVRRLAGPAMASLVDHEICDLAPDGTTQVSLSVFSDGTRILCDYALNRLEINGEDYLLPNDYQKKLP